MFKWFCLAFSGILFFISSSTALGLAEAKQPLSLSLSGALRLAKERSVDLIVASERVRQALARTGQAKSYLWPHLTGGISQQRQTRDLKSVGIALPGSASSLVGPFNSFDARVRLNQMIFDQATLERLSFVREGVALSRAEYLKAEQDALALVAHLYIEAERSLEAVDLARVILKRDQKGLRIAHRAWRNGKGVLIQVMEAKAGWKTSISSLETALAQIKEREMDLGMALGLSADQRIDLNHGETLLDYKIPSENEIVELARTHPQTQVARSLLKQQEIEEKVQRAESLPKVSAAADYGLSGAEPDGSNDTYTIGLEAKVPLFDGGERLFKTRETESKAKESRVSLDDVERRVQTGAFIAVQSVRETLSRLKAKDADLWVSEKKRLLAKTRFENGLGSEWEFFESEAESAFMKDQRKEAVAAYLIAEVNLAHSVGQMNRLIKEDRKA